jgi:hypothetical protein
LRRTCRSCGFTRCTPLIKGGAALFQSRRKRNRKHHLPGTKTEMEAQKQQAPRAQTPPITPAATPSPQLQEPTTSSDKPKRSKNRKARSGLQEMLERKRKQDQLKSPGTSLGSFLQGL